MEKNNKYIYKEERRTPTKTCKICKQDRICLFGQSDICSQCAYDRGLV